MDRITRFTLFTLVIGALIGPFKPLNGQVSVAHQWMATGNLAVQRSNPRPTVIARIQYLTALAMYDAWAAYDTEASTVLLGKSLGTYNSPFTPIPLPSDIQAAREEAMSFAAFRILMRHYSIPPGDSANVPMIQEVMLNLGYDMNNTGTNYLSGDPAQLGNYIAEEIIAATFTHNNFQGDGANEFGSYSNQYYLPSQDDVYMLNSGNSTLVDFNRWQELNIPFITPQQCNFPSISVSASFLSPEWGNVIGFALDDSVKTSYTDDRGTWHVYHDPGPPPYLSQDGNPSETSEAYKWGFELVSIWSSHLSSDDGVMWDISPASVGNMDLSSFPVDYEDYDQFYNLYDGGDPGQGYELNPTTNAPYDPQIVPRGDYARVLAEFWADGPDSETPPGHWVSIYNEVSQHPLFTWKWEGKGEPLDHLEYDAKAYLTLTGGLHDAAISAWGVKGYYDYIRPVSAIRGLSDLKGQCSDPNAPFYNPDGLNLHPGYIELIEENDPLLDEDPSLLGEIKGNVWLGPNEALPCSLQAPGTPLVYPTDISSTGWKPLNDWWSYQRPTFITPPFAGYVSGHSTFSRAAAEILTDITGDPYFPGGMSEFVCPQDSFLVFEQGPSQDIILQWATYRDASDQCSLSRIWGGIHPPADDLPGRRIGYEVGKNAFAHAQKFFDTSAPNTVQISASHELITDQHIGETFSVSITFDECMDVDMVPVLAFFGGDPLANSLELINAEWTSDFQLEYAYTILDANEDLDLMQYSSEHARDRAGNVQVPSASLELFLDTENPMASLSVNDLGNPVSQMELVFSFSEVMDMLINPSVSFPEEDPLSGLLSFVSGTWTDDMTYRILYDLAPGEQELLDIDVVLHNGQDVFTNIMAEFDQENAFSIDSKRPEVLSITPSTSIVNESSIGSSTVDLTIVFSEPMDQGVAPDVTYPNEDPSMTALQLAPLQSMWIDTDTYIISYDVYDFDEHYFNLEVACETAMDKSGNLLQPIIISDVFTIDTKAPTLAQFSPNTNLINDDLTGTNTFFIDFQFDEEMDSASDLNIEFSDQDPLMHTLSLSSGEWIFPDTYRQEFSVTDAQEVLTDIDFSVLNALDQHGNSLTPENLSNVFAIDMENPIISSISVSAPLITSDTDSFTMTVNYNEEMDANSAPQLLFNDHPELYSILTPNVTASAWITPQQYALVFDMNQGAAFIDSIAIELHLAEDTAFNEQEPYVSNSLFSISRASELSAVIYDDLSDIEIYPNPVTAGDQITVILAADKMIEVSIELLDLTGRFVYSSQETLSRNDRVQISTAELGSGIYLLSIGDGQEWRTLKLEVIED